MVRSEPSCVTITTTMKNMGTIMTNLNNFGKQYFDCIL